MLQITYHTSYMTVEACRGFIYENQIGFIDGHQLHSDGESFQFTPTARLCLTVRHITDHQFCHNTLNIGLVIDGFFNETILQFRCGTSDSVLQSNPLKENPFHCCQ